MTHAPVASVQPLAPQPSAVIILVDDAVHLQATWEGQPALAANTNTHWVLVACAPRMAQRPSKWGSHRVREHWRTRWSAKLFEALGAWLQAKGQAFTPVLAEGPLPELTQALMHTHGASQVLDLRRPKGEGFGAFALPAPATAPAAALVPPAGRLWSMAGSLLGVGLLLGGVAE